MRIDLLKIADVDHRYRLEDNSIDDSEILSAMIDIDVEPVMNSIGIEGYDVNHGDLTLSLSITTVNENDVESTEEQEFLIPADSISIVENQILPFVPTSLYVDFDKGKAEIQIGKETLD